MVAKSKCTASMGSEEVFVAAGQNPLRLLWKLPPERSDFTNSGHWVLFNTPIDRKRTESA